MSKENMFEYTEYSVCSVSILFLHVNHNVNFTSVECKMYKNLLQTKHCYKLMVVT